MLNATRKIKELGFMVDCSRGAVLKVETVYKLIDILSKFGYTYLMLYTEDTYEIDGEPYFGYKRGRYSKDELKAIDAYAKSKNIELRACIQTLAHLERLLRHNSYKNLFEIDNILEVKKEETYQLIDKMFKTIKECFSSNVIHIGMDEAWKLGRGKYLNNNGYESTYKIMQYHLNRVCNMAKEYGFECYMWADMLESAYKDDPKNYDLKLPDNVTPFAWRYWPVGKEEMEKYVKLYQKLSPNRLGYAGAAHKWSGFVPGNYFSIPTYDEQIPACIKLKVDNYLVTAWGDGAADASIFSVIPAMFYASLKAHALKLNRNTKKYFEEVIGINYDKFLLVDKLNKPDDKFNYTGTFSNLSFMLLYMDVLQEPVPEVVLLENNELYKKTSKEIAKLSKNKEYGYLFDSFSHLGKVLSYKANLSKRVYEAYQNKDKEALKTCVADLKNTIKELDKFILAYEAQWLRENKGFGYEKQSIRLGGLKERLASTIRQLNNYIEGRVDHIDELEEKHLVSNVWARPIDPRTDELNGYNNFVSGGIIIE